MRKNRMFGIKPCWIWAPCKNIEALSCPFEGFFFQLLHCKGVLTGWDFQPWFFKLVLYQVLLLNSASIFCLPHGNIAVSKYDLLQRRGTRLPHINSVSNLHTQTYSPLYPQVQWITNIDILQSHDHHDVNLNSGWKKYRYPTLGYYVLPW